MPGKWIGKWTKVFERNLTYQELYRDSFSDVIVISPTELKSGVYSPHDFDFQSPTSGYFATW